MIQPGRVSSQRLLQLHIKKIHRRREGPRSFWAYRCQQRRRMERKEERKWGRHKEEWRIKGAEERKQEQKKQSHHWKTGAGACWQPGEIPSLVLAVNARRCGGLIALGAKSDSQFWYLLRKSIGGIPWLADRRGRKQQQWGKTRFLPPAFLGMRLVRAGWSSSLLSYDMQKENN